MWPACAHAADEFEVLCNVSNVVVLSFFGFLMSTVLDYWLSIARKILRKESSTEVRAVLRDVSGTNLLVKVD